MLLVSLALSLSFSLVAAKLQVYDSSETVKNTFKSGIRFSQAEFGHYTYNKQFIGQLVQGSPFNGCQVQNTSEHKVDSHPKMPFLLVERGDCTFVTKAKFAQLYGAKLLIVVDNLYEDSRSVNMADDGHGFYGLSIPTVLIGKWDGQQLVDSLRRGENTTLSIQFDAHTSQHSSTVFYLTTANRQSFKLVRDFAPFYKKLEGKVQFEPRYALWTNIGSRYNNFTGPNPSQCVSRGRYCSQAPHVDSLVTGKDIVMEDLRQLCIWKTGKDQWFSYMLAFDELCVEYMDLQACGNQIISDRQMDRKAIDDCISASFVTNKPIAEPENDDNSILSKQLELYNAQGVYYTPSAYVNGFEHKGRLNASDILENICASTLDPIDICEERDQVQEAGSGHLSTVISIVCTSLLLFFVLMVCFYRRMVRRELSNEVHSQVNQMLSQYMAFKDNNNRPVESIETQL